MREDVIFEVSFLMESFITDGAFESFDSVVGLHVSAQSWASVKGRIAMFALEGFVAWVDGLQKGRGQMK